MANETEIGLGVIQGGAGLAQGVSDARLKDALSKQSAYERDWAARQKFAGLRQTLDRIMGAIMALENHAVDAAQVDTRLLKSDLQNAIAHSRNLTAKMVQLKDSLPVTGGPGRKKAATTETPSQANGSEPTAA